MARILVIDDEKNVRKMVRLALQQEGHSVEVAEDGPSGLELFGEGAAWDLVITDQRMPGLEGREVTYEMRRRDPAARLVMMTAFATTELAAEVLRAGATDFLRKPFSTETLRGAVTAALSRPKQETPVHIPEEFRPVTDGIRQPAPSQSSAVPQISFYWNGVTFWPVIAKEQEQVTAGNFEIYRVFQVRRPSGKSVRCTVAVTPHIVETVRQESSGSIRNATDNDYMWEFVCRRALLNFVWEKAEMPPTLLPVYELTERQLEDVRSLSRADNGR